MVFGQEKLIEDDKLKDFLNLLGYYWDEGYSAKKIAKVLEFGVPGTMCEKMKTYHVYYFAEKYRDEYGFTPRGKKKKNEPSKNAVPYTQDMPPDVANYLRAQGLLLE
jgi:hypothetical protein